MFPKRYRNPPIVEAVVELRFAPGDSWTWGAAALPALAERFRPMYPGPTQRRHNLQVRIESDKPPTSSVMSQQVILPTLDGKALVGLGENLLSVHVLAPYPGWNVLLPRVVDALAVYREVANPDGITLVGVRYLDAIIVPDAACNLLEYFPCLPARPTSMPSVLQAFQVVTQAHDEDENFTAVLTLASQPTASAGLTLLYDLNLVRPFASATSFHEVEGHATFLHDRQRLIFEDSITDTTRRLFQ